MTGIQLSAAWVMAQAAESLAASSRRVQRQAGRSLRCCEVIALDRVPEVNRKEGKQGVEVRLRFYRQVDLDAVLRCRGEVEARISEAFGLWHGAVQLNVGLITSDEPWLGVSRPSRRGGTGLRLDRYLTDDVLDALWKRGGDDWGYLGEHEAEVRILLRRLRYKFGQDYGTTESNPNYAFWTTDMTKHWAAQKPHKLNYLVHRLSNYAAQLENGGADSAYSLDARYWGEVDTKKDPLRVIQMTTGSGTTALDVQAVLSHAGRQIEHCGKIEVRSTKAINKLDPVLPFILQLERLVQGSRLENVDVLLIHRGGGVNPTPENPQWTATNVPDARRREFLELCVEARDWGVEVVVALGHANISILDWDGREDEQLPLGIFEATTPTAAASWILQEHIDPGLVDTALVYGQEMAT